MEIPESESYVAGVTVLCEVVPENIAIEQDSHLLMDEYLLMWVRHDGSNPFCGSDEVWWGMIFAFSQSEIAAEISLDGDTPFQFFCCPKGVHITDAIVTEDTFDGVTGIWLLVASDDPSGDYDLSICLRKYMRAN